MDFLNNSDMDMSFEDLFEPQMEDQGQSGDMNNSAINQAELEPVLASAHAPEDSTNTPHHLPATVIENTSDDDDVVMIDPKNAPEQAQRRWADSRQSGFFQSNNRPVIIKREPMEDRSISVGTPAISNLNNPHQLLGAQWRMLASNAAADENPDIGLGSSSTPHVYAESSSRNQHSNEEDIGGQQASVDASVPFDEDDNSWMQVDPEEDEEYQSLTELRTALERRRKNKNISANDLYELLRVESRLQTLDVLKAASKEPNASDHGEEEQSLFVEDNIGDQASEGPKGRESTFDNAMNLMEINDEEGLAMVLEEALGNAPKQQEEKKPKKPRKKPERRPKDAREFHEREAARRKDDRTKARHMRESKAAIAGSSKSKGKGKGKGKKGAASTAPAQDDFGFQNDPDNAGRLMMEDLVDNNPIEDRIHNPIFDVGPEPEMTDGKMNKTTQFQKLFANIPAGGCSETVRNEKKKLQLASRSFGYAKVRAVDGKWLVKGMKSTLYHHQLLGSHWMVGREIGAQSPNGGLLADSMGLGKTIQTLACMVGNPPTAEDLKRRTKATLIVVPAAVIAQWNDEIGFHVEDKVFRKVLKYKTSSKLPPSILQDCDIIITSYTEVMKEFPFPDSSDRASIQRMGYKEWMHQAKVEIGPLHKIKWYRVVLDEAHAIKNNSSRTSLACQNLRSIYRWCLTGTPILNRVEELFPYLRFLKADYAMDWQTFQKYFCDFNTIECRNRLAAVLSYTMMRRTMGTTIMNRPIITLPVPHPKVERIDFSKEEKIIYRITENRFRQILNTFIAKGDVRRKYGIFMVQLLRLRQCTSHPFMLERTIKESWTSEDVVELRDKLSELSLSPTHQPFYEQTKVWVHRAEAKRAESGAEELGIPEELAPFGKGSYGTSFEMDKALDLLDERAVQASIECDLCGDVYQEPMETNCGHIFCQDCLEGYLHNQTVEGHDHECHTCKSIISKTTRLDRGEQQSTGQDAPESESPPQRGRGKQRRKKQVPEDSKGRDAMGFEPYTAHSTWLTHSDRDPNFPLVPSAKTAALKSVLLKGFTEAPLDKVVIYVQFRALARIVGRMCKQEGWNFLYLSGDCTLEHRTKALKMFREDPEIPILIAGLKCGGIGLNFPWANRCISLDLWWNHGVEQQAFGRIFRIGQKKETYMTRIIVKNSVDMRLLSMQGHKLRDVDRAITETNAKPSLSVHQLANLFGFLKTDADGEIVSIEADYKDNDEAPGVAGGSGIE